MPRHSILSSTELGSLFEIPDDRAFMLQHYTLSDSDKSIVHQHRGASNKLGFAIQLCYMRYPGVILGINDEPFKPLLFMMAAQLSISVDCWNDYGQREQTRREHIAELKKVFGFKLFTLSDYRQSVNMMVDLSLQTDKGLILATTLVENLRQKSVLLPAINAIDSICAEAITSANRIIYTALTSSLSETHRQNIDALLNRKEGSKLTILGWLRQSPAKPNSKYMLEHIERLKCLQAIDLPEDIGKHVHQNRLLKIAREGGQMTPADLARFESQRRYATLVAIVVESMATITDEIIDLHDRIIGKLFAIAKNKHQQQFQSSGKAINDKVRLYGLIGKALLDAKQNGSDPFAAIETVISWDAFAASITEAEKLAQPEDFDFLPRIGESYATLRRYAPELLAILKLRAAPAAKDMLAAVELLRSMNVDNTRKIPSNAPIAFIKKRWARLVFTDDGIDRRYYEICVLSELKNSLRAGDLWVQGSRQFKDFDEYLVTADKFNQLKQSNELPLTITTDCDLYLQSRLSLLEQKLAIINRMAATNDLPDAMINPKYGAEPGRLFYTHISDQYAPFSSKLINVGVRDSTYVLDGLLYHESDLRIEEHYTDTAGFTDHVFALMHMLGFRFAPRIRDLGDTKLYIPKSDIDYAALKPMIGGTLNIKQIRTHWDDILRLAASIKQGTVTASLMLRKLGSYPRQNGLALALRELGRIERTLFILDWLQSVELRRRVQAGLNKGEARNALARAVFFYRLGEIRDRSFEQQRYRASGLNLVTAAIVLWNTVYLERATNALRGHGRTVDDTLLQYLSPLGWEHINLTGDYLWRSKAKIGGGKFRPLRAIEKP
ncbi:MULTISPECIES: Tn3 family transposase [Acinetobacter]|jgi:TnpA family transposase|uniref:Tn3 family transposase n=2 Tax=Acinetobacter TaxID=469 RepID=A0ABY8S8I0_9GAMM|nr:MULTISPECIES: Tn3 family transposase [Acinetobacter]APR69939.1 DDE transposase [Acinetobacter haemolyticus]WHP07952.1 Tn3 family transposase [Acinetobacter sp. KCTC 92772]